ncbi:hypothetical protein PF005_g33608 [Phytophthora fragariae]|uniref:Secreted protein n=1 Tax=Phytophthora fragariae TaxID=53985 RepID=A0A6A3UB84_9STRA|nr:hypothetical protein PF003_g22975 [Phytophthora fragariae]KAE8916293.1 hypothetical protein PF009_g33381 [Phytophthora fragariae]KAE8951066.1 hypothetical protein PF011_g33065 [Phytophthora fragariae]KAE9053253.1 hypothetical protein PF007_g33002 [Phytophthora fragariae]KAE9053707.1 hypothetical protein PF006_g33474 [Phytophthora fragariae]
MWIFFSAALVVRTAHGRHWTRRIRQKITRMRWGKIINGILSQLADVPRRAQCLIDFSIMFAFFDTCCGTSFSDITC